VGVHTSFQLHGFAAAQRLERGVAEGTVSGTVQVSRCKVTVSVCAAVRRNRGRGSWRSLRACRARTAVEGLGVQLDGRERGVAAGAAESRAPSGARVRCAVGAEEEPVAAARRPPRPAPRGASRA
jgi:hypothetical protein